MTTITISATITSSVIKGGASAQPPVNTIAPVVSGSTSIGSVLSCTTGTWTGTPPITYTYQWARGMSDIPGATSPTYTLVEADAGNNILCQVTATNIAGSSSVSSNALAIPLLLDSYPNAAVAYSVRKLRTAYSGSALRVRRSSDNAETNIGFVSNQLDTASLLSFVGAGNGFVTTWYDQSGNGNNLTQTTAANQPRIVNAGVLETQNGKATVRFDGSNDELNRSNVNIFNNKNYGVVFIANRIIAQQTNESLLFYSQTNSPVTRFGVFIPANSYNYGLGGRRLDSDSFQSFNSINPVNNTTMFLNTSVIDWGNSDAYIYINNVLNNSNLSFQTNGNTSPTNSLLMSISQNPNRIINANISEVIAYESSQNISAINTNINSYYSVWSSGPTWDGSQSGMLNTYSGAAVAYSVRALNSAYTGPLIRVRRSSDNTEIDIFALYNGELDTTFLLNFVGAGNGFVARWYDQSGNGRNVTQTTAANQPSIVNAGVLETQNGKVTVRFDGSNDSLFRANTNIFNNKNYGVAFVANRYISTPVTSARNLFFVSTGAGNVARFNIGKNTNSTYGLGARRLDSDTAQAIVTINTYGNTSMYLNTSIVDWGNSDAYIYINNNIEASSTTFLTNGSTSATNAYLAICSSDISNYSNANVSEVIAYESSQNISAINTNINSYFNIYP